MKRHPKRLEELKTQALQLGFELTYSPSRWIKQARSSANLKGGYFSAGYYYLGQVGCPENFHVLYTQAEVKKKLGEIGHL